MNIELATGALKDLTKALKRHTTWHAQVDAYIESGYATGSEPKMRVPSKASKHQMYATAGRVILIFGLDPALRPSTLAEIQIVVDAAKAKLQG